MSRDREGAVPLNVRHKHRHRVALAVNDVCHRSRNIIPMIQPASTPMPRPPFSILPLSLGLVQSPASIRFESIHHFLGFLPRLHNNVDMCSTNVRRQKRPSAMQANFLDSVQHRPTRRAVQKVRGLIHEIALARYARRIGIHSSMSRNVMVPIHGTGFVAVHMSAVTRERNQVRHAKLFYTAPSRSRLV